MEPDEFAGVVEDHGTALARPRGGGDEHETAGRTVRALEHRYRRRLQVRARDEPLDVPVRCRECGGRFETCERMASGGSRNEEAGSSGEQIPAREGLQVDDDTLRGFDSQRRPTQPLTSELP
jgi:hypothetical protein